MKTRKSSELTVQVKTKVTLTVSLLSTPGYFLFLFRPLLKKISFIFSFFQHLHTAPKKKKKLHSAINLSRFYNLPRENYKLRINYILLILYLGIQNRRTNKMVNNIHQNKRWLIRNS